MYSLKERTFFVSYFPSNLDSYMRFIWPIMVKKLGEHGIAPTLDLEVGSMTVKSISGQFDPAAIINARNVIRLLAKAVPLPRAINMMENAVGCDIIDIGDFTRNMEEFERRRERLIGRDGESLRTIQLMTGCDVFVQGHSVCAIGSEKGLKVVRRVVEDCMGDVNPINHLKELLIRPGY